MSPQTVWAILKAEGLERLERRRPAGPAPRLEPVRAKAIGEWPTGARYDCDHAGLYLLLPAIVETRPRHLDPLGPLPGNQDAVVVPLARLAAAAQGQPTRPRRQRLPARRRPRARPGAGSRRDPQGHPPHQLLLPGAALLQRRPARRTLPTLPPDRALHRRRRVQLGLPHHPPPRRRGPARRALRRVTLPAHPLRAHLLRPRPRLHRNGLRQRGCHQSRTSPRGDRLRRLLVTCRRHRPRPAGVRLQTHHLPDARRALRPRRSPSSRCANAAPKYSTPSPRCPASAWTTYTVKRSGRYRRPQIHEEIVHLKGVEPPAPPDRHPQHRPRPTHPADHQRPTPPPPKTCSPATPNE